MERTCESCKYDLGGGYNNCRINLESECAAGDYEAWEPKEGMNESQRLREMPVQTEAYMG